MKLRLDPWPADYESPLAIDNTAEPARFHVNTEVESAGWRAVAAPSACTPRCYFVDGVRRVDARVLADSDGAIVHGLYGTLATGCVRSNGMRAEFDCAEVERYLILGKGKREESQLEIGSAWVRFTPWSVEPNTPEAVLAELQTLMRQAEARLAERLASDEACVFVDGLSYRATAGRDVVGVIKRILEMYLSPTHFALVESLRPGERTPLFSIEDGKNDRYSCFLRLAMPRAVDHPLTGMVRIEIGAGVGIDRAVELARAAAATLPRFASTSLRDPRAPQNLLPVGALESELRRRMGDAVLIRRAIEGSLFG